MTSVTAAEVMSLCRQSPCFGGWQQAGCVNKLFDASMQHVMLCVCDLCNELFHTAFGWLSTLCCVYTSSTRMARIASGTSSLTLSTTTCSQIGTTLQHSLLDDTNDLHETDETQTVQAKAVSD